MAGIPCKKGCRCGRHSNRYKGTTHKMSGTPTYKAWADIINRCFNVKYKRYFDYGGRGISVSDEWRKFDNFYIDMGERPNGLSIDRVNNDLGYSKENCVWSDKKQQQRNRRNTVRFFAFGEMKTIGEWAEDSRCCVCAATLWFRISKGIDVELSITNPPDIRYRRV